MGVFGFAEIIANLEHKDKREVFTSKVGKLMPSKEEFRYGRARGPARHRAWVRCSACCPAAARCSPRSPPTRSKRKSAQADRCRSARATFEGVAAPESANNAGAQTSFIPLLTLGIPPTP